MSKTLELIFQAEDGSTKISIKNPKEPLSPAEIKAAMETMIQSNAFQTSQGNLLNATGARLIDRTIEEIELT